MEAAVRTFPDKHLILVQHGVLHLTPLMLIRYWMRSFCSIIILFYSIVHQEERSGIRLLQDTERAENAQP